ncbi:antirestriction protein [Sphingobium sp. TA15]|uniref:Antirestriction protein ArdC n=1 Tax=Sphingobium indicum (strain DSM 16413 / CCM 7287 / MTCC 6362 / UT26 / NBRC 101211 / UT26S) TaxID=452662 RepID=D4Z8T8_SPHIU|nr:zincin-like metallopeptidase domain-containing protein [Sphingobium indicum]BAI99020.1 antirestriction protein ArdC [Sphingobium indicum UT26S]BDD65996.1 antirestriction protein [Sphingobium sp. TA15]
MPRRFAPRSDAPSPAQTITDAIIARLETGTKPWVKPWTGSAPQRPLRVCGTPYRGANIFWLWLVADLMGYRSPTWMTYRQSAALGGQVRKGEKATIAIFYKSYAKSVADPITGEEDRQTRRVLRSYPVFNCDQIDDLPDRYYAQPELAVARNEPDPARVADLMAFFDAIPAEVRHGGDRAYFHIQEDYVQLPPVESFADFHCYSAIRCHELAHWSGAESRLDRKFGHRFGDEDYAVEELCAELTSAILGSELNLPVMLLDNHASYIQSWIDVLRADSKALLTVASKAEEAASYLLGLAGRHDDPAGDIVGDEADNDDDVPAEMSKAA